MLEIKRLMEYMQSENLLTSYKIKVEKDIFKRLDGKKEERVRRVGDGSIICIFDKTPHPEKLTDVVCPHFLELKWANGCYFDCSWCYLNGTYRFHPEWKNGEPNIKPFNTIESHVSAFLNDGSKPEILNTGELSDSLLCENKKRSFSNLILPLFNSQKKHKVLFLTKGANIKNILKLNMPGQVIMSWSLNALPVAQEWEKKAPSVERRIKAAKEVYDKGYEVRIRIDPMVPIEDWEIHYKNLIDMVFSKFTPERITFGSLRGLQTTIRHSKDKSWIPYMTETSNWGRKIDFETRFRLYSTIVDYLQKNYNYGSIALCKETIEMWKKLEMDHLNCKCNCVW